ncbi:MAG: choice-of-anchor D domain-containing protein [Fibrobacter sp.]|nr:choice-of-anchor D domain-containing protein [Fibrobacter sp.]
MFKRKIIGALSAIVLMSAGISGADKFSVKMPYKEVTVDNVNGKAVFDGTTLYGQAGQPNLPFYSVTFLLPSDADIDRVSVVLENEKEVELVDQYDVDAVLPPVSGTKTLWPKDRRIVNGKDTDVYEKDAFFPASNAGKLSFSKMGNHNLVTVPFYPVRYNPVTKKLKMITGGDLSVLIASGSSSKARTNSMSFADHRQDALLKKLAVNYEQIAAGYNQNRSSKAYRSNAALAEASTGDVYVILTVKDIINKSKELQNFIRSKENRGFNVKVIDEDKWGGNTGDAAAENMRTWLKGNYLKESINYVLLIGNPNPDTGTVPMKMACTQLDTTDTIFCPTDCYYSELSGNWDLDGDGLFGEYNGDYGPGGVDKVNELSLARIPYYDNIEDLDKILAKIITYENSDGTSSSWRSKILLPMEPSDYSTPGCDLGEAIVNDVTDPAGWKKTRIYEKNYGVNPEIVPTSTATVLHSWKTDPAGLVIWWTHGWYESASDIMTSRYAQYLDDQYPAFTFQVSCLNAHPETPDNLCYSILKNGGISTIGATRESWYMPGQANFEASNSRISYEFARSFVKDGFNVGSALTSAKSNVNIESGWQLSNWMMFCIYGDPALSVYTSTENTLLLGNIPDQKKYAGEKFEDVDLNSYVFSSAYASNEINWSVNGYRELRASIVNGVLSVITPNTFWSGSETLTIEARTPDGKTQTHTFKYRMVGSDMVYLSDLEPSFATAGWSSVKKDMSVGGNPIRIASEEYKKGLGTHANSEIVYNINGQYDIFSVTIGADDETDGSVIFEVLGDNQRLFKSGTTMQKGFAEKCNIVVRGVHELRLLVTDAYNGINSDHADWADARLIKNAGIKTVNATIHEYSFNGCWQDAWSSTISYKKGDQCTFAGNSWRAHEDNFNNIPTDTQSSWYDLGPCPSSQTQYFGSLSQYGIIAVESGDQLTLSPNPDYKFELTQLLIDGQSGTCNVNGTIDLGTITDNRTLEVTFDREQKGYLRLSKKGLKYNYEDCVLGQDNYVLFGKPAYVYALPVEGYRFVRWEKTSGNARIEHPESEYTCVFMDGGANIEAVYEVDDNPVYELSVEPTIFKTGASVTVTAPSSANGKEVTFTLYRVSKNATVAGDFVEEFTKTLRAGTQTFTCPSWDYLPVAGYYNVEMTHSGTLLAKEYFEKLSNVFELNLTATSAQVTDKVTLSFDNPSPYLVGKTADFKLSCGNSSFKISKQIVEGVNIFTETLSDRYYPFGKYEVTMYIENTQRGTAFFEKISKQYNLNVSVKNIDFGTIDAGTTKKNMVTLTNDGNSPALISDIFMKEPFSVEQKTPITVPAGESITLTVLYKPLSAGNYNATMTIVNAPDAQVQTLTIGLSGSAENEVIATGSSFEIIMIPDSDPTGNSIQPQFKIKNTGKDDVDLSNVIVEYYTCDPLVSEKSLNGLIYYCSVPNAETGIQFTRLNQTFGNNDLKADTRIEFYFKGGSLGSGKSFELKAGINEINWGHNFMENDDWSHQVQTGNVAPNVVIRDRISNKILYGTLPDGL